METGSISFIAFLIAFGGAVLYMTLWILLVRAWYNIPLPSPEGKLSTQKGEFSHPPISLIIAAHNEEANLSRFLSSWLNQDYPIYECIIVLDRCTDGSVNWLADQTESYPNLKLLIIPHTPEDWSPKKWAIHQGIQSAQYEWMAFTDADCFTPPSWLYQLSLHMEPPHSLILGLGNYEKKPGGVNLLIQFETFYTAFQYIGFASMGIPYMSVGRNMAYTQTFYKHANAYRALTAYLSGDDDLLVNSSATPRQTTLCIHPDSITVSIPKDSLKGWISQKTRHLSASKAYSSKSKLLLGLFHGSHLCFYLGLFVTMIANFSPIYIGGLYIGRMVVSILTLSPIKHKIYSKKIIQLYPLFDFFIFTYNLLIVPLGLILKPEWKKDLKHPKTPRKIVN